MNDDPLTISHAQQRKSPPFKAPLENQNDPYAIYTRNSFGPTFGNHHDIHIYSESFPYCLQLISIYIRALSILISQTKFKLLM